MIEKIQLFLTMLLVVVLLLSTVHLDSQNRELLSEIKNIKNVIMSTNEINDVGPKDIETSIKSIKTIMNSFSLPSTPTNDPACLASEPKVYKKCNTEDKVDKVDKEDKVDTIDTAATVDTVYTTDTVDTQSE